jgi:hypothetical protein
MSFFRKKTHDRIEVQFVDLATGQVFSRSLMSVERLPQSFEASTTLHLKDQDWSVVEARPMTAAEYRSTGKLLIVLSKVEKIDPSEILFSLPTVAGDALPPIGRGTSKLGTDAIEIHEDDWRQIEWLPTSIADLIERELKSVMAIHEKERQEIGFAKCHLRPSLPNLSPDRTIRLSHLREALGPNATWLRGFGIQGIAGIAANSFAVRLLSSIELFGIVDEDKIRSICFANTAANNIPEPDVQNLAKFAAAHDLLLVDWCRVLALPAIHPDYVSYFTRA